MKTQIVNNNGVCMIESIVEIAPELVEVLKDPNNKEIINNALKDFGIGHRFEENVTGCVSIAGIPISGRMDVYEIGKVNDLHDDFLGILMDIYREQHRSKPDDKTQSTEDGEPTLEDLLEHVSQATFNSILDRNIIVAIIPKDIVGKEE